LALKSDMQRLLENQQQLFGTYVVANCNQI